jgi:SAM-dependent methyltransferase
MGDFPFDLEGRRRGNGQVERINPKGVPQGILSLHKVRYEFAKQYCGGKAVLDMACGAGYGAALLAEVAESVVGADINEKTVNYARCSYRRDNLAYRVEDAQGLSFESASFDTVVSFETIEHLSDIPRYLNEVQRVLRPGGIYIVSTPKAPRTTTRPKNPHHTVEFSAGDFRALLRKYFHVVELHGQVRVQGRVHYWLQKLDVVGLRHYIPTELRRTIDRTLGTVPFEDMRLSDQKIVREDLKRAHDMIAVCTW